MKSPTITLVLNPREQFRKFIADNSRWSCLVCHRRAGKTFQCLMKLVRRALEDKRPGPPRRYGYIAPSMVQAKDIAWSYLKRFLAMIPGIAINESELKITLPDGTTIRLYSGENYDRMRGLYFDGVVIDEPEDIPPQAWPEVIRPCLSDYSGWAIWIGTIKGIEGHYQRYMSARDDPDWYAMMLKASESGIIPEEELADIEKTTHPDIFAQEFECEPRISRCVFTKSSLDRQDVISATNLGRREFGYFVNQGTEEEPRVIWSPTSEDSAMTVRWEQPRIGHRYLISVDSASGADQTGGEDPDSHSLLVHRAGYISAETGEWFPPALVARNMLVPANKPGAICCWWAQDVLEEQVWMLCTYYKAFLVPEYNHDKGLVEAMRRRNIPVYKRVVFDKIEQRDTNCLGWMTTNQTKPKIIAKLEITMREMLDQVYGGGYEVRCPWILKQMRNFGTRPNGRQEALFGHDDDVVSVSIGLFTIDSATPYHERIVERALPRDLQRLMDARQASQSPGTYS